MNTVIQTKTTSTDLQKRIKQHLEELAQATDKARTSDEMVRYLYFCSRFHQYSATNIWLIMLSNPNATIVAGFSKWRSMGRVVVKGQKAIWILAPILYKETDPNGKEIDRVYGFKPVPVFDISQTSGKPLPPPPDWKSPKKNLELNKKLIEFAKAKGISVKFTELPNEVQGISKGGSIEIDVSAGTKTLIHEIAHELMHRGDDCPVDRAIRELQAEAVAYVVSSYFGMKNLRSPNYLSLFGIKTNDLLKSSVQIHTAATNIITWIENGINLSV